MIRLDPPPNEAPVLFSGVRVPNIEWGQWFNNITNAVNERLIWERTSSDVTGQTSSHYLDIGGLTMSATLGIPLMRAGSVTGVSATLVVNSYSAGAILSMDARIDNSKVFGASKTISATGLTTWSSTQNTGVDIFSADSLLQVYLTVSGTINYDEPIAEVEITVGG